MDCSALAPYFRHYDSLVSRWLAEDDSSCEGFLPEPWWGWSGNATPLYAVIINLNPGEGGPGQQRRCVRCTFGPEFHYRESMADGSLAAHLPATARWHRSKRELPVLRALGLVEERHGDAAEHVSANTLCIEAYPRHTDGFDEALVKKYWLDNPETHFWKFIHFAAAAAKLADGALNGVVLVRISWARLTRLTEDFKDFIEIKRMIPSPEECSGKRGGRAVEFYFRNKSGFLDGVRFICVWSGGGRNNLPANLRDIFKDLHLIIN